MTKLVEMVPRKFVGNLHYLVQAAKFPQDISEQAYCPGVYGRSI